MYDEQYGVELKFNKQKVIMYWISGASSPESTRFAEYCNIGDVSLECISPTCDFFSLELIEKANIYVFFIIFWLSM